MEKTVKQRLIEFLKYKGLSQGKFAAEVGLSSGFVNAISKSIGGETLHRISMCFPDLNTGWLLTGEGEMLKTDLTNSVKPNTASADGATITMPREVFEQISKLTETVLSQQRTIESMQADKKITAQQGDNVICADAAG